MDLFEYMREQNKEKESPLASRMRPKTLEEVVGQSHIIGKDKLLYRAIVADKLSSIILYGPPGTGKTHFLLQGSFLTQGSNLHLLNLLLVDCLPLAPPGKLLYLLSNRYQSYNYPNDNHSVQIIQMLTNYLFLDT